MEFIGVPLESALQLINDGVMLILQSKKRAVLYLACE